MTYTLRYTAEALEDFDRIYDYLIEYDIETAERVPKGNKRRLGILVDFPFSCRRADGGTSVMRELLVPFGSSGYVVLFRIDGPETVYDSRSPPPARRRLSLSPTHRGFKDIERPSHPKGRAEL